MAVPVGPPAPERPDRGTGASLGAVLVMCAHLANQRLLRCPSGCCS
ncbi:hypothetical protein IV102_09260 [bacterium]|nr:hypothetical protein [bacterium]